MTIWRHKELHFRVSNALESRLEEANRTRRRIYSAPVGAFGNAPFVRRRGFKNRRRGGIRVRFNRGIRG